jgi:rhomboid protease GluP
MEPETAALLMCPDVESAHELGLVVLSAGWPYWVETVEQGYELRVPPEALDHLMHQIGLYREEQKAWPPVAPEVKEGRRGGMAALAWALGLFFAHGFSQRWPSLRELGRVEAIAMVEQSEWYRSFTALFLHADLGHLTSNLLFGAVLLALLSGMTGGGWALVLTLLAGALGNAANAFLHYPEPHLSIGASTAVFATLGILCALPMAVRLRWSGFQFWRSLVAPAVVGAILLAWFGTGTVQTDTSAHLTGYLAGFLTGLVCHRIVTIEDLRSPG